MTDGGIFHIEQSEQEIQRGAWPAMTASHTSIDNQCSHLLDAYACSGGIEQSRDEPEHLELPPSRISKRLYISHFLSSWNSRVFEFGSVLCLAALFPGTLLPMSIYALARSLSAVLFASAVGQFIDTQNRLRVLKLSIGEYRLYNEYFLLSITRTGTYAYTVLQRLVVTGSCLIFYILAIDLPTVRKGKIVLIAVLALLACLEKLCAIMNSVAVEKDWVRLPSED